MRSNTPHRRKKSWLMWACGSVGLAALLFVMGILYTLVLDQNNHQSTDNAVIPLPTPTVVSHQQPVPVAPSIITAAPTPQPITVTITSTTERQTKGVEEETVVDKAGEEEEEEEEKEENEESLALRQNDQQRSSANAEQLSVFDRVEHTLKQHPLQQILRKNQNISFEDYFVQLKANEACSKSPIFISMANVFSDLYWQMIENFIYTMVKFELSDCAVMICVSDPTCMARCKQSNFPCIDFQYQHYHLKLPSLPSTLEQIAELKLLHIPKALKRGVDIMMLDLDVGFLSDPRRLLECTLPKFDVYVQKDIAYVMNRTEAGWRTWYTVPLPNIGIMYVRANEKSAKMFKDAWDEYRTIDKPIKHNPGKDQNKVAGAMFRGHGYGLRWAFFPAGSAILLDMMYKFNDPRYELGGLAAYDLFTMSGSNDSSSQHASSNSNKILLSLKRKPGPNSMVISGREERLAGRRGKRHRMSHRTMDVGLSNGDVYAVHTTCYEQSAKIHGLKASNAYWNPYYYTANRRTLIKPLVYITEEQLRHEVRTLLYLAHVTNRALIIPNVLGNQERLIDLDSYRDRTLWPGFRVLYERKPSTKASKNDNEEDEHRHNVTILEPAYYWRIQRDYFMGEASKLVPEPVVVPLFRYDPAFLQLHKRIPAYQTKGKKNKPLRQDLNIADIEAILQSKDYQDQPRLVLGVIDRRKLPAKRDQRVPYLHNYLHHLREWAHDSVGDYDQYEEELQVYAELPRLNDKKATEGISDTLSSRWITDNTRLCRGMFQFDHGNRSCFDKCK